MLFFHVSPIVCNGAPVEWSDWDRKQTCHPSAGFVVFGDEDSLIKTIKIANKAKAQVKTVGAGHSFSTITLTDDNDRVSTIINLDEMKGVLKVERNEDGTAVVTFGAGTRLRDANTMLEELGLAFINLGATAAQSVAGATATATHGTGRKLQSISSSVKGLKFVDGLGNLHFVDEANEADTFKLLQVGLGAFGVITEVKMLVYPLFKMKRTIFQLPLSELIDTHDFLLETYERFQWSYIPHAVPAVATVIVREEVPFDTPVTGCWPEEERVGGGVDDEPKGSGSECIDISYKVLVDSYDQYVNRTLYTEMEMMIDVENAMPALKEFLDFQESVKDQHSDSKGTLYSQLRYVKGDDLTLSPFRGRNVTAVFSFIVSGDKSWSGDDMEFGKYAKSLEKICSKYNGVPHWGKQNYAKRGDVVDFYTEETLEEFDIVRLRLDPNGVFLNDYLRERFLKV